MICFIDVETLPTNDPAVIAEIKSTIKPPGTIKKQESIDAWMAENQESALNEAVHKTGFSGLYGRIACLCWSFDDGVIQSSLATDTEAEAINRFYASLVAATKMPRHGGEYSLELTFCGHNLAAFDLPFIKHRSIILGINPPINIRKAFNAKPWDSVIADTMLMWSSDKEKRASMDKLCRAFGIPGKGDFDGSMVAATWPVDPKKVIDYCKDDVRRTRDIYNRLTFNFPSDAEKLAA